MLRRILIASACAGIAVTTPAVAHAAAAPAESTVTVTAARPGTSAKPAGLVDSLLDRLGLSGLLKREYRTSNLGPRNQVTIQSSTR